VTLSTGALGALGAALAAYIITWCASFTMHLLNAPVVLYHEQKDRADKLEGLRQAANDAGSPSFDIGFEYSPFDEEAHHHELHAHHSILRIWVENLENRSIEDCRVIIENFGPTSTIRKGAMLLPDDRSDDEQNAQFHLAATERKFFRFIEVESYSFGFGHEHKDKFQLTIRCDQEGTGTFSFLGRPSLGIGEQYFATIAVHGKNANSRRIALTIDALSATNIHVVRSNSTPATIKENA